DDLLGDARGRDVARHGESALAEQSGHLLGSLTIAHIDGDRSPALVEALGGRPPEPAHGSGDDRDSPLEVYLRQTTRAYFGAGQPRGRHLSGGERSKPAWSGGVSRPF